MYEIPKINSAAANVDVMELKWGPVGHAITASVAQRQLSTKAASCMASLVSDLGEGATWPDVIKKTKAYHWSARLHYFASPKKSACRYDASDCPHGKDCVVGAIHNYTNILQDKPLERSHHLKAEALKFLTHYLGDIHQPLHIGYKKDHGGNKIKGTFFGMDSDLHSVWDDAVINKRLKDDFSEADGRFGSVGGQAAYITFLSEKLKAMPKTLKNVWNCPAKSHNAVLCPEHWADESARLACDSAYKTRTGGEVVSGFAYTEPDYAFILPIIETQLIKGAHRLSLLLERLSGKLCPTAATESGKTRKSHTTPSLGDVNKDVLPTQDRFVPEDVIEGMEVPPMERT